MALMIQINGLAQVYNRYDNIHLYNLMKKQIFLVTLASIFIFGVLNVYAYTTRTIFYDPVTGFYGIGTTTQTSMLTVDGDITVDDYNVAIQYIGL